jgi:hypothetical protein
MSSGTGPLHASPTALPRTAKAKKCAKALGCGANSPLEQGRKLDASSQEAARAYGFGRDDDPPQPQVHRSSVASPYSWHG